MPQHAAEATPGSPTHEVARFLRRRCERIARRWADEPAFRTVFTVSRDEAVEAGRKVADALARVAEANRVTDPDAVGFTAVREQLSRTGAARSRAGLTAARVSHELAGLRPPVERLLVDDLPDAPAEHVRACATTLTELMGTLRVVATRPAPDEDRALAGGQRPEPLPAATPVVTLWDGIVAVPMTGTLDSARSHVVTETFLKAVVERRARFAILDITGVPTVDSPVARHLMRTVEAVRLLGAECVVSGVRPAIAQTLVRLGADLGTVTTRAGLADALAYALRGLGADVPVSSGTGTR
ncbi:hypothetical protein GCM10010129_58860 [Streptomyces fumigatiscleroticus]|nr:hypothetical protein GCM10010129_58860 [Streptomyces fumigatiscleroticus]